MSLGKKKEYLMITFPSTVMAMAMEKKCRMREMDGRLIPVPKDISAGCGMAWRSELKDAKVWFDFMKRENIAYEQVVLLEF